MHTPPWEDLYRYWLEKHVAGQPPSRADIDPPTEIPRLLGNLILVDFLPDGYRYRLCGSVVVAHQGSDMSGKRVGSSGAARSAVDAWLNALDQVSQTGKPKILAGRFPHAQVARNVIVFLPLVARDGRVEQFLVGSFYDGYFPPGTLLGDIQVQDVDFDAYTSL